MSWRALIFFPMESTKVKCTWGNRIARGIPGMPPPVPKSSTVVWGGKGVILAKNRGWAR